jgi:hypothetical protein
MHSQASQLPQVIAQQTQHSRGTGFSREYAFPAKAGPTGNRSFLDQPGLIIIDQMTQPAEGFPGMGSVH